MYLYKRGNHMNSYDAILEYFRAKGYEGAQAELAARKAWRKLPGKIREDPPDSAVSTRSQRSGLSTLPASGVGNDQLP